MCGRYCIAPDDAAAWAPIGEIFGAPIEAQLAALEPQFNVAPSTQIPIILRDGSSHDFQAALARWGFIPHWWRERKLPAFSINARSEEAEGKPMWREAWQLSRCLIPATHWYEWRNDAAGKQPFALTFEGGKVFCFAGLYAWWRPKPDANPILSAAIITRAAAPAVAHVHDRMPVILHASVWREWLDPQLRDPVKIRNLLSINAVLNAIAWPVSSAVNSSRNTGPELLRRS
jgi:putative SOS response-associated peptidase YedK